MTLPTSTVVICAYTLARWDDLQAAVASAQAQTVRPDEVIVVIDHNDELLARAQETFTGVTVVANENRKGLSGGRNTAIRQATGEVIAFLDDDATAVPEWLATLLGHYRDPDVVAVGGSATPVWPNSRPPSLPAAPDAAHGELDWVVGCTYQGQPESVADVRNLMGCNMSFRASSFARVGGFREEIGRVGKTPLGGEETEFCIRVRQDQPRARIIFDPAAAVQHRVSADRVAWRYLLSRCYAEGISKAAVARMVGSDDALSTERSYATKVLPAAAGRELRRAAHRDTAGLAGAGAIALGLAATSAGYARALLARRTLSLAGARQ